MINAGAKYAASVEAITSQLNVKKQQATSEVAKALAETRKEILAVKTAVNEAKMQLDQAANDIKSAEDQKETLCRGAAEGASTKMGERLKGKVRFENAKNRSRCGFRE